MFFIRSSIDWAVLFFLIAYILYGSFSYAYPKNIGFFEGVIALLLMFSFVIQFFSGRLRKPNWLSFILFSFATVFVVGFVGAYEASVSDIVRDVVPVFYFFIPVFFFPLLSSYSLHSILPWTIYAVGVLFSARYLVLSGFNVSVLSEGGLINKDVHDVYNIYDAAVSFAYAFGIGKGVELIKGSPVKGGLSIMGGIVCLLSVASLSLRAPTIIPIISLVAYFSLQRGVGKKLLFLIMGILFAFVFSSHIFSILELMIAKNELSGSGAKTRELYGILEQVIDSGTFSFLFGSGWGALYHNVVLNAHVSFTHSGLTYFFLKAGLIGLVSVVSYVSYILIQHYSKNGYSIVFASSLAPIVIAAFFEASYKSLSLGFIFLALLTPAYTVVGKNARTQVV